MLQTLQQVVGGQLVHEVDRYGEATTYKNATADILLHLGVVVTIEASISNVHLLLVVVEAQALEQ